MAADAHEIHKTTQNTRDQNKTFSAAEAGGSISCVFDNMLVTMFMNKITDVGGPPFFATYGRICDLRCKHVASHAEFFLARD